MNCIVLTVSNSDYRENEINDDNSKTDDEFDNKDDENKDKSVVLTKANDDEDRYQSFQLY